MRKFVTSFALLILCAVHALSFFQSGGVVRSDADDDEYAVYSALINERHGKYPDRSIVIVSSTLRSRIVGIEPERIDLRGILSPLSQLTLDDYKAKNKDPRPLKEFFKLKGKYALISEKEWEEFFDGDVISGWENFYRKHPDSRGVIRLSRVGFNPERTQALVFVMHGCGATCGEGTYALLRKTEDGWRVWKTVTPFVS